MFEKEAEEYSNNWKINKNNDLNFAELVELRAVIYKANKDGAEFGYSKATEDVKHDLMMKLKDEGIVKPLKDSILRNERLSSQEQQELCAWIECAMDFGENLDECVGKLAGAERARDNLRQLGFPTFQSCKEYADKMNYAKTIIQDLLSNSDEYARQRAMDFLKENGNEEAYISISSEPVSGNFC